MKKASPKQSLKSLSWTYVVLAVIMVIVMIGFACIPDVADKFAEVSGQKDAFTELEIAFATNALLYLWYFWLARRFVAGKSKGTFYMILLAIGVVGGVVSFFAGYTKAISSIDFIIDVVALYFALKIKKEEQ